MTKSPYATLDNPRKRLKWLQERLVYQEMMLRVAEGDLKASQKCVEGIRVEIAECEKLVEESKQNGKKTKNESARDSRSNPREGSV